MFIIPHNFHQASRYFRFIHNIRNKEPRFLEYSENHHIIPCSLGGTRRKENMIKLSYREHFIAHLMLFKCFEGKEKAKMAYALNMMLKCKTYKTDRKFSFSKKYEEIRREAFKACSGPNNPMWGKPSPSKGSKRSKKFCENQSKRQKEYYKENPVPKGEFHFNYGKTMSEEAKLKRKITRAERTYDVKSGKDHPLFNLPRSEEVKKRISESCKQKPKIQCPHCSKELDPGNFKLHHGDRCKFRIPHNLQP